MVFPT